MRLFKKLYAVLPLVLVAGALLFSVPGISLAEKGKGRGHEKDGWVHSEQAAGFSGKKNEQVTIRIDLGDRDIIKNYIRSDHRKGCPPGLAKKNNGCLPPGIAKKYAIGQRLPDDVVLIGLPDDLLKLLKPAPKGHIYARVDKDILLVSEASKKVIDAVTLLSAVGN